MVTSSVTSSVSATVIASGLTVRVSDAARCRVPRDRHHPSSVGTTPWGSKRITTTSANATMARPTMARSPDVNAYSDAVMTTAPAAGPSQCRAPPRMLMSTT